MKTEHKLLLVMLIFISNSSFLDGTRLNYVIQHQILPKLDYVQVRLKINTNNIILSQALAESQNILAFILQKSVNFCQLNSKNVRECQNIAEIQQQKISPLYRTQEKKLILQTFDVNKQVTLRIQSVKNIGVLVDQLIAGSKFITMTSFDWKSFNKSQDDHLAIAEGIEEGRKLCQQLGKELKNIISIQEVAEFQQQLTEQINYQNKQEFDSLQQKDEQIFAEVEHITLKFQVQCEKKRKT